MLIKKYVVNNMNEALTRIRYELGKDAVIISQRKVKKSGFKGLFSKKQIEVTAAVENSYIERNSKNKQNKDLLSERENLNISSSSYEKSIDELKKVMNNHINNQNRKPQIKKADIKQDEKIANKAPASKLEDEMQEMKKMLSDALKSKDLDENDDELLNYFNKTDIDEVFYDEIKKKCDGDYSLSKFKEVISSDINISSEELNGNVVLVGPTGVGKTTTIAKLAGKLSLVRKKKVGLITVDTYRIGAVEQLKTYAEIMNIPFEVVITIKEMEKAIEKMKDCDVVLIDTTGRSSKNKMQISELRAYIQKAKPKYINVVVSATTKNKDLKTILDGYSVLNYGTVIITKLDETTTYGSLYNISKFSKKPIRYITTGQNVPDDIKDVTKEEIMRLIFEEEDLC